MALCPACTWYNQSILDHHLSAMLSNVYVPMSGPQVRFCLLEIESLLLVSRSTKKVKRPL